MDDALRQELFTARSPEDKAAIVAEGLFATLPESMALLARRCSLLHWFNGAIIEALTRESPLSTSEADVLYGQFRSFPMVETLPWGLAYNKLTREGLLRRYSRMQPELLRTAARLAVLAYRADKQRRALSEAFFCSIVAGDTTAAHELLAELLKQAATRGDWEYIGGLMRMQDEAESLPFVQPLSLPAAYRDIRLHAYGVLTQPFTAEESQTERMLDSKGEIQSFDICIVCALAEEAKVVINEFSGRCKVDFKQAFSKINGYEYQHATINNNRGEPLTALIIWMPFTGPIETVNSVRSLLEEFHPRFVAMTGICAGYREKVALGDLVAAAYAFHYEEGKVEADGNGQDRLHPEWRTHGTAKRIVQYINNFTAWETPVTEMKQRVIGHKLQESERPRCLIAPIASGMAVQSNNPFPRLVEHNRKALFLDQEVAAFYQTLNEFPDIYFLAVKGVCDYADPTKNDTYHKYAAQASAIYLLYFLKEYVTDETMPRRDDHQSQNQTGPSYQVGIQNNSSGDINIQQSQVNIASRDINVTYLHSEFRAFKWTRSRRQFLAGLAGLAITGSGIAWFALSQRSKAPPYATPVPLGTVLYTYRGHSDLVLAVTWSPDSKRIASASADKTVQVWDARDGGQIYKYPGHGDFVYAVAWSPDGTRIASGSSDGTAQVWDPADDGRRISTYHGHANAELGVQSLAWSPDGTRIASGGSDGTVQVWYAADGGQISTHTGHAYGENAIAWSPHDGKYIAFGSSDTTVQVWDATDGTLVNTYRGHSNLVRAVAWSPDGKYIASGSRDHTMQVWKAVDSTLINIYHGHTFWVEGVAWSPDGKRIVSGSWDTTVRVWNAVNGQQVYIYTGHSDPVNAVKWSPDGTLIASGSGAPGHGAVQVWGAG